MSVGSSVRIEEHFESLTDPRRREPTYPLVNIVVMALCAVPSGADDFVAIAAWARGKQGWLAEFLDLSAGVPSHDRFNAIFAAPTASGCTAEYHAWNRLVSVDDGSGDDAAYEYDGLHRRIVRTEGTDTTHFYYNERWQCLSETDGSGNVTAVYLHHPHYVDAFAVRMTPDAEHVFTHDALFSVTAAVEDGSPDAVVERYTFSPYGAARVMNDAYNALSSSAIGNELLFTGRRVDPGTGLQLNRHRYYHQGLGRWTSRDPIGYWAVDANLYGYVWSDPTNLTDPDGLLAAAPAAPAIIGGGSQAAAACAAAAPYAGAGVAIGAVGWAGWKFGDLLAPYTTVPIGRAIGNYFTPFEGNNAPAQSRSLPLQGPPGGTLTRPGQTRTYGEDGYPETDIDSGHDHGAGDPHAHPWGRPANGGPPTHLDRGPGQPIRLPPPPAQCN